MIRRYSILLLAWFAASTLAAAAADGTGTPKSAKTVPPVSPAMSQETITFGGGCFWCLEAVFQRLEGVVSVVSGYAGGPKTNPTYEEVCNGTTGHAEVVQIRFDTTKTSYARMLEVFWAAHDPTSVLDQPVTRGGKTYPKGTPYQGGDIGTQYRSIILYENETQKTAALASKATAQKDYTKPIATEIVALEKFYPAESYHQNYYNLNKDSNPYCSYVITPKLKKLLAKGVITETKGK